VDPRAGLDDVKKRKFLTSPGFELQPLGRPTRSQSLYRLHYSGSFNKNNKTVFVLFQADACATFQTEHGQVPVLFMYITKQIILEKRIET
jgi:hypothetical protein